jgi:hypothetical protein
LHADTVADGVPHCAKSNSKIENVAMATQAILMLKLTSACHQTASHELVVTPHDSRKVDEDRFARGRNGLKPCNCFITPHGHREGYP